MANTKREFIIRTRKTKERWEMVQSKAPRPHEGNELKIPTERNKGKVSKPNKYRYNKPWNKPIPESRTKTDFQGRCTDLEGYTFDLGPIAFEFFQKNEVTGVIPWNNIQWQMSASHHNWNYGHLPRPRDAYHHWFGHQAPQNRRRDDLHRKKEYWWGHLPKSWGRRIFMNQTCTGYTI